MSKVLLLVGTRKGCFVLESNGNRRDWDVRGPFCEGWPVYHAVFDHDAGGIYAAAASEWHGATVWRSGDLGETWTQSSEGLGYGDEAVRAEVSKVSSLSAAHGRLLAGAEQAGIFESRDGGANWKLLARSTTLRARTGTIRPSSRPATWVSRRLRRTRATAGALLGDRPRLQPVRDD